MSNNFKLTYRMTTALEEPIELQTVRKPDIIEDIEDQAERNKFTSVANTQKIIRDKIDKASPVKYSETKDKLFPNSRRLNEIRVRIQEATADEDRSIELGMPTGKYVNSDVHRKGPKGGYLVPLEKIHKVLVWAHKATDHGGRDATYDFLKQRYSVDNITKAFVTKWVSKCPHEKHQRGKRRQAAVVAAAPANTVPGPVNPLPVHVSAVPAVDNLVVKAAVESFPATADEGYGSDEAVDEDKPMEDFFDFESASEGAPEDTASKGAPSKKAASEIDLLAPVINWNKCS